MEHAYGCGVSNRFAFPDEGENEIADPQEVLAKVEKKEPRATAEAQPAAKEKQKSGNKRKGNRQNKSSAETKSPLSGKGGHACRDFVVEKLEKSCD